MRRALLLCAAAAATAQTASTTVPIGTLEALYDSQKSQNPSLYATAVLGSLKGEVKLSNSRAFGSRSLSSTTAPEAMSMDTQLRIGSMAEMMVVATALTVDEIYSGLSGTIPRRYLPNNVDESIKYLDLMQHTSQLRDPLSYSTEDLIFPNCDFAQGECSATLMDFEAWVESTFTVTSSGQLNPQLKTDTPGYRFAHVNTALLAYVLNRMVVSGRISVVSAEKSVGSLIYERVIQPLGMSSTFYQDIRTIVPLMGNQALSAVLSSMLYEYQGTTRFTMAHPNKFADVMQHSTAFDLMRFANQMLATSESDCVATTGSLCGIGRLMRDKNYMIATGSTERSFQTHQGLGIQYFSPGAICGETVANGVFEKCPLDDSHLVWGYVTGGTGRDTDQTTIAAVMCTDALALANSQKATCTVVVQGHKQQQRAGPLSPLSALAMGGASYQVMFGETTVNTSTGADDANDLYGLWVGFGVFGTIIFVIAASYFTEFLIQPPPPMGPGTINPGQNPPKM